MGLERLKIWQWMIIGLVVGFVVAYTRQWQTEDALGDYTNTMNSVTQFEAALVEAIHPGVKGYPETIPAFKDLIVYPAKVRGQMTYIVAGKYCHGRSRTKTGGVGFEWLPFGFVQEKAVYKPHMDLAKLSKAGGPDYVLRWKAISNPSVLDFMKIMGEAKGINFRYAWWAEPKKAFALWMGGGFVIIGLIWPFIVNLIAFGSLKAPPEEKKINLRKVAPTKPEQEAKVPKSAVTAQDMDDVARMVKEQEERLMAQLSDAPDGAAPAPPAAGVPAGPQPIKQLTATKLETSGIEEKKDDKAFGASADDFYPTERKAKPNKPS